MKALMYTATAALIVIANPAQAQLLGGGGMPAMPTMPAMPSMPSNSGSDATAAANGSASVTKRINTRSGSASADGSSSIGTGATLIGTAATGGAVSQTRDSAGNHVTSTHNKASARWPSVKAPTGSLSGSAQGSAAGSNGAGFAGLSHNLALTGSAAADGAASFDVKPGTNLFNMDGEKIGKVRDVFADAQGHVKGLVVQVGDINAVLPAANFAADGNALVTLMSESQIAASGERQETGSSSGLANGIFAGLSHNLAVAGSLAADGTGSFGVKPGMSLRAMTGAKIGQVQRVNADTKGRITALAVKVDGQIAVLPVSAFAAMGKGLVTSLSEVQITAAAQSQAAASGGAQAGN